MEIGRVDFEIPTQFQNLAIPIKLLSFNINPQIEFEYEFVYANNVKKPWSVCHISPKRKQTSIEISFSPRALGEFDNWEIEQNLNGRQFEINIRNSTGAIVNTSRLNSLVYDYQSEINDFGIQQNLLDVEIWEIGENGKIGHKMRDIFAIKPL